MALSLGDVAVHLASVEATMLLQVLLQVGDREPIVVGTITVPLRVHVGSESD